MKIIECPRDAMQGLHGFVPTEQKIEYINQLLRVGFDTIDFGSFVSPRAIPQMRDTKEVLSSLDLKHTKTKLLAIIANTRGAHEAAEFDTVDYLGFPLSLSETFQQRNTKKSIAQALEELTIIQDICKEHNKTLVTYLSMGFGNPYGDSYEASDVIDMIEKLKKLDVQIISLADTVGLATPELIKTTFRAVTEQFPDTEFGAHLHSDLDSAIDKVEAAYKAGCTRFDGAINGFGGCPMAEDKLVGNIATETILAYFEDKGVSVNYDGKAINQAINMAPGLFLGK
ncbi:hydroxymethylglutaryl-CoA lyase [Reichenbachiella agariperforans]|uniref:Hydroxymethylglutaryl-CoA lyase n=1 Tax=Reichenbachiella agariperforans TaxID=156994 RepID=A0A1M6L5S7_REIAG|nr:hydroxymethylglutaryl-CoA lyase [Reichenbachiella agariperforans]MBU2913796.1 hydroxymethylglutaryl-CoA lyase [Reichenbachiella agariperforans]SHJ66464.1 hydroxymethylglutaryl-CoA lyase [Reichenbachiella agariperforans]